ncbi:AAA family ATPase [Haloferula sp.]|uniref:AAA family ATPase n=1 Tax=Haloferula sp. TaxID=2497595 RepID=UPI003C739F44
MSELETTPPKTIILPFQKAVYNRLCAIGRACLTVNRSALGPLKLRTCFLLLGPTGSGKTFLARAFSKEMNLPIMSMSTSDWILMGSTERGARSTWPAIFDFIERVKHQQGAVIFIDELDKCASDSPYTSFLRAEVFSLCDGSVPMNLKNSEGELIQESRILEARDFLVNKTMILAGAAFQEIWEVQSKPSMGFLPSDSGDTDPELPDLARFLPREMINRFSSEIFVLPRLTMPDYRVMVETVAEQIPVMWRERFLELGIERLDQAVRHRKGARYLEEILLAAIVMERDSLVNFVPTPTPPESSSREVDDLELTMV